MKIGNKPFLAFLTIAAAAIVLTSTKSFSQSNAAHLVGSWKGAVVGTSPPGLTPFTSLIMFTSDGSVIESRRLLVPASPLGPLMETSAHGAWERIDEREFDAHFVFLLQGAVSGADIGTDNVHLRLSLDPTGKVLSGTFDSHDQRYFRESDLYSERHVSGNANLA